MTFDYDAAGNLTYDQLRHYVNDAAGRMKSFGPGLQSYAYDGAEARRDVGVTGEMVTWSHEDPASTTVQEGGVTSFGGPNATFLNPLVELDPVRANVGWADPAQFEPPPPDETSPEGQVYNNPLRPGATCFNNFVRVECRQLMEDISWRAGGMRLRIDRLETGTSFKRLDDLRNFSGRRGG